jgi:CheY-like chemotaxis protein
MRVLIIEDDATDRKLLNAVLKMSGHMVRERGAAEEAIEAIAADKPDVILLDLRLPGIDGLALTRQLKDNPDTRDIPIVAITSYPDRYRRDQLMAAGCAAYITKPINTRDLPGKLEQIARSNASQHGPQS